MDKPKCLILDIETSPLEAYVFDRKDQNIGLSQIKEDWFMMAWSAKWLDTPANSIAYYDQRRADPINDDKKILKPLWEMLDKADIVITQNGKNFDGPKINARFILNGFNPPIPYKHLDTYQIARKVASFTSNKLEYLTDKLCVKYKKLSHKKFPGMILWRECLKGNKEAWDEMRRYNTHDTLATEELYQRLSAWTPTTLPNPEHMCPRKYLQKYGFITTDKKTFQRYSCKKCGDSRIRGEQL